MLIDWGSTWLWDSLRIVGEDNWLEETKHDRTCLDVTNGSYMKELYPDLCSAAFVLECSKDGGGDFGSFPEQSVAAGAYQGDLLGLMEIHLVLLAVNKVSPTLQRRAQINSYCMSALGTVSTIPTNRIPFWCKHSDILKNIMVNCWNLNFACSYSHVISHQDDDMAYQYLSRPYQLNCIMNYHAKKVFLGLEGLHLPSQDIFPLEPVAIFVGNKNMTSNTGDSLQFRVHQQLAKEQLFKLDILTPLGFKEVAWRLVYDTLHKLPRLF